MKMCWHINCCEALTCELPIFQNGIRMTDSHRWKFIVEEDHFTLLIYEVTVADAGRYDCVVMNKFGKATCTAHLQVDGK